MWIILARLAIASGGGSLAGVAAASFIAATPHTHDGDAAAARKHIIEASRSAHAGACPCPYDHAADGKACGLQSTYGRREHNAPMCYESDVDYETVTQWLATHPSPI